MVSKKSTHQNGNDSPSEIPIIIKPQEQEKPVEQPRPTPNKELLRVDEVADFFSVTERTIRLWIEHGHLQAEKVVGIIRISRESVNKCRFAMKTKNGKIT